MLNLERLRTLDALARHGSVSGAAEGLHVTTSAVSQQLAKLEREIGQQLLAKNGRGVRLTDAGRLLADTADVAMPTGHRYAERAEVDLEDFADDDWITWGESEFCHEWLIHTLRSKGIEPRVAHRAEEHPTQLALVGAGLGVCVAPRLGRGPLPEGVRAVPVRQSVRRQIYAVWRADADRRPSIR